MREERDENPRAYKSEAFGDQFQGPVGDRGISFRSPYLVIPLPPHLLFILLYPPDASSNVP